MMGKIILENGMEEVFLLSQEDVEVLEREAEEVRRLHNDPGYSIASELVYGAFRNWIRCLREAQGAKDETPGAGTPRGSR